MRPLYLSTCLGLACLLGAAHSAAETFIYEEDDGTRWITNQKMYGDQWTFIDKYGRPTATKSCKGMTPQKLEQRAQKYMGLIQQYSEQYKLEVLLVKAVVRTESCFDRRATSRAGAEGLMQLMPRTAQGLGVLDSFNARLNIEAGTRYLSQLKKRFNNNMTLALAAYNAGQHNVKKHKGIPPFKETQNYVRRIAKFHQQYLRESIGLSAKK